MSTIHILQKITTEYLRSCDCTFKKSDEYNCALNEEWTWLEKNAMGLETEQARNAIWEFRRRGVELRAIPVLKSKVKRKKGK